MRVKKKSFLSITAMSVAFAIAIRLFFGVDSWSSLFSVMSMSFLFVVPFSVGLITTFLSKPENLYSWFYRIFSPWLPITLIIILTIIFGIEGWACWIMISPVFFIASSFGGIVGAILKIRKGKNRLQFTILVFLPFLLSPIEQWIGSKPVSYKAYTFIDINAPADLIWDQVTRVKAIEEEEDSGWLSDFLGFPRPVEAKLDFEGVGAFREAKFTGGLIFNERVIEYEDNRRMKFTISANTYEIPSTTLDEHILIGGDYFDVLEGVYELEKLGGGWHRLHLYSEFELNTTFNFYAGWWGKWIMKDIQNNILRVEKKRAEG